MADHAYYEAHRDQYNERTRQWRLAHPERVREWQRVQQRRHRDKLRSAVFDHYGRSCACCGSTNWPTIDHIDGNGGQHREQLGISQRSGKGFQFYRWLIREGFPAGFQTLCMSCNVSKRDGPACRINHATKEASYA